MVMQTQMQRMHFDPFSAFACLTTGTMLIFDVDANAEYEQFPVFSCDFAL